MKLTDKMFIDVVKAATMAPSSDNMQPWKFEKKDNCIEVRCVVERLLKIDVMDMFSMISIGAAIENIVCYSEKIGLKAEVIYNYKDIYKEWVARIFFREESAFNQLGDFIESRTTNRSAFQKDTIANDTFKSLEKSVKNLNCGFHWTTSSKDFSNIADIDKVFSSILLEHAPLFDGFFDTLLFTKKEIETIRIGMDIKSLDIPFIFAFIAKRLKGLKINRIISRLGMGHIIADILSSRLKQAGGLLLITAKEQNPIGFVEAGRAMERVWLYLTSKKISVHPYGVIPQYLTMADISPETFLEKHVPIIKGAKKPFFESFPEAKFEYPAVMLRIGYNKKVSCRTTVRLKPEQVITS